MGGAAVRFAVQKPQIRQRGGSGLRGHLAGIHQPHRIAHKIADHLFQQRVVGAAKDQRVNAGVLQLLQILGNDELCHGVAVIEIAVLDQRHKHRAGARKDLHIGQHIADDRRVGAAAHRGGRADDADAVVAGRVHGGAGGGTHHAGVGHRQPGGLLRRIGRGHGPAGGDDELDIPAEQKAYILPRILHNDVPPAAAVRHAAGIAEIDDILTGQHAAQLAHGGQPAKAAVKYADGPCVHQ